MSESEVEKLMLALPVSKVWGIAIRLEAALNELGVNNVLRLKNADPKRIRDRFGVVLERTVRELNGDSWLELDEIQPESKQVMSSRSFGTRVDNLTDLEEAVSYHSTMAGERMRMRKWCMSSSKIAHLMKPSIMQVVEPLDYPHPPIAP